MKAVRVHEFGDADALRYEDIPTPEPGPGEARVKVEAAGLNFIDIYHRSGAYPLDRPFTLGLEGAGVVDELGPDSGNIRLGDRVAYTMQPHSYAEYVVAPVDRLMKVPDSIETTEAAAAMLQGLTAHYLVTSTFPLQEGQRALVHAAAGGVGQLLVQMAKLRGAWVVGTVSTEEKARLATEAGADEIIRYTEKDFEEEVKRLTSSEGVDVVYDSVGKDTFDKSLNCLRPRGYMVLYGQSSGAVAPFNPQILNQKGSLFLTRPSLGPYIASREELEERTADLFGWMVDGDVTVHIDQTFPLADAAEAHRYMEARKTKGKVLLVP